MALRTVRVIGDDVLRKNCREVKEVNERILTLIDDMLDTMYEANGVGLAAPQVTYLMAETGMTVTTVDEAVEILFG